MQLLLLTPTYLIFVGILTYEFHGLLNNNEVSKENVIVYDWIWLVANFKDSTCNFQAYNNWPVLKENSSVLTVHKAMSFESDVIVQLRVKH